MSKQKRRTTRSTATAKKEVEDESKSGASSWQDESAPAKVQEITKRFAVPPEIEKLLLQSILWSRQVNEEVRRKVETKLAPGSKAKEDRKRKKNDEEERKSNRASESEKRLKLEEEAERQTHIERQREEEEINRKKEEQQKREVENAKKEEEKRLKEEQRKMEKAREAEKASLEGARRKQQEMEKRKENELKLLKAKEEEERRKLEEERLRREAAEKQRQEVLAAKLGSAKKAPLDKPSKQFGSAEKQGRKLPLTSSHSFLTSVVKGGSEKKLAAEEIRRQGEERLREKQAAEDERLREQEEARKRKMEEKHHEREEKMRRAEERRREAERAKAEKANAIAKQRQLQLAAVQNLKHQLKQKGQTEAKRQKDEEGLETKHADAAQYAKPKALQQKVMNTTYDADEEDGDENDGGGTSSTPSESDKAKKTEAPPHKPVPLKPASAAAPPASKPATGPNTPKQATTYSYDITPHRLELPPEPLHDPENYDINDLKSDEDTDDDEQPRKEIPQWAAGNSLRLALMKQTYSCPDLDLIFAVMEMPDLTTIFKEHRKRFFKRTSSAQWGKLPTSHKV